MRGWLMAFAAHLPAGQGKFCPGAAERWEGGQVHCPGFVRKRGQVKERKLK